MHIFSNCCLPVLMENIFNTSFIIFVMISLTQAAKITLGNPCIDEKCNSFHVSNVTTSRLNESNPQIVMKDNSIAKFVQSDSVNYSSHHSNLHFVSLFIVIGILVIIFFLIFYTDLCLNFFNYLKNKENGLLSDSEDDVVDS